MKNESSAVSLINGTGSCQDARHCTFAAHPSGMVGAPRKSGAAAIADGNRGRGRSRRWERNAANDLEPLIKNSHR